MNSQDAFKNNNVINISFDDFLATFIGILSFSYSCIIYYTSDSRRLLSKAGVCPMSYAESF